jgi:hypothetical protein
MATQPSILELNDSGLKLLHGQRVLSESPGIALIADKELTLGKQAQNQARLHPLKMQSQFWQRLDTETLNSANPRCRHQADLVFEHLKMLKHQHPEMAEVVLALPAYYNSAQLSLLLGIAQHCGIQIKGLIDSAVASVSAQASRGRHYHIDMHLHQTLVSQIDVADTVKNTRIEAVPNVGLASFNEAWAKMIAEQFILQSRFNPLHDAATEQQVYNQLDEALTQCQKNGEVELEFSGKQASIKLQQFEQCNTRFFNGIKKQIGEISGQLFIHERVNTLPGFAAAFPQALSVDSQQLAKNIEKHHALIHAAPESLKLVSSLPSEGSTQSTPTNQNATHLLWQHRAHPIGQGVYLTANPDQPLSQTTSGNELCRIERSSGQVEISHLKNSDILVNGKTATDKQQLIAGDEVKVAQLPFPFTAISVLDNVAVSDGA